MPGFSATDMEFALNDHIRREFPYRFWVPRQHDIAPAILVKAFPRMVFYHIFTVHEHFWCFKTGEDMMRYHQLLVSKL